MSSLTEMGVKLRRQWFLINGIYIVVLTIISVAITATNNVVIIRQMGLGLELFIFSPTTYRASHASISTSGLILGLRPANERRRYFVTTSVIGWAQV